MDQPETTPPRVHVIDIPEAVGIFDRPEDLQAAIYDLRILGFSRHDISLLARQEVLEGKLGRAYWRADDLANDPRALRAAFVSEDAIGALEGSIAGGFLSRLNDRNGGDAGARQHIGGIHRGHRHWRDASGGVGGVVGPARGAAASA